MTETVAIAPAPAAVPPIKNQPDQASRLSGSDPKAMATAGFSALVISLVGKSKGAATSAGGGHLPGEGSSLPDAAGKPADDSAAAAAAAAAAAQAQTVLALAPTSAASATGTPQASAMDAAQAGLSRLPSGAANAPSGPRLSALSVTTGGATADGSSTAATDVDPAGAGPEAPVAHYFNSIIEEATTRSSGANPAELAAAGPTAGQSNPSDATLVALQGQAAAAPHAAPTAGLPTAVDSRLPIASPQFGDQLAQQVTVLVDHGIQHAMMSLSPPDLGPIEVRISLNDGQANVQMASPHGVVREAMTNAMPQLRDMLQNAGMQLSDSGVFSQLPQHESRGYDQGAGSSSHRPAPPVDNWGETPVAASSMAPRALRLVDAYV